MISRLKSRDDLENDNDDDPNNSTYEQRIARANVAQLSRAERRARARAIMKEKRRVAPTMAGGIIIHDPDDQDNNDNNNLQTEPNDMILRSRKERQKAAKATERRERKLMEQERQQQQKEEQKQAQIAKKEREKALQLAKMQEKIELEQLQKHKEQERQQAWNTFLSTNANKNSNNHHRTSLSVKDWIAEVEQNRMVDLRETARRFGVTVEQVVARINTLLQEGRLGGVFARENTVFIFLSEDDLQTIANHVIAEGKVTEQSLAQYVLRMVQNNN